MSRTVVTCLCRVFRVHLGSGYGTVLGGSPIGCSVAQYTVVPLCVWVAPGWPFGVTSLFGLGRP